MKLLRNALVALVLSAPVMVALAPPSLAQDELTAGSPPPPLPVTDEPLLPAAGYIWTPGYWAYDDASGYFWIPGAWVLPPEAGLLWTPGYWAYDDGTYDFHPGYWADQVGYYGGIDYGFGYTGFGYQGGYWLGDRFFYNLAVTRIVRLRVSTFTQRIVRRGAASRVSFNGGPGGVRLRPTPRQVAFERERHLGPTPQQAEHARAARQDPSFRAHENGGRPPVQTPPRSNGIGRAEENLRRGAGQGATRPSVRSEPPRERGPDTQPRPRVEPQPMRRQGPLFAPQPQTAMPQPLRQMDRPGPRFDAPRFEAPRYGAPRFEQPRYEAPRYQAPRPGAEQRSRPSPRDRREDRR